MRTFALAFVLVAACDLKPADKIVGTWKQESNVEFASLDDLRLEFRADGTVDKLGRNAEKLESWTWKRIDAKTIELTPAGGGEKKRGEILDDLFKVLEGPESWTVYRRRE
jgi:hypothetical protein